MASAPSASRKGAADRSSTTGIPLPSSLNSETEASSYSRRVKQHGQAWIRVGVSPCRRAIESGRRGAGRPAVASLHRRDACLAPLSLGDGGDGEYQWRRKTVHPSD